jgi:hypothetical protein
VSEWSLTDTRSVGCALTFCIKLSLLSSTGIGVPYGLPHFIWMICFWHWLSALPVLTICVGSAIVLLTCSGVSQVCLFSLTMSPSLYLVKAAITYIFHGSLRRFRMPWPIRSLRSSRRSSAVDFNCGPLMPVLLVCVFVIADVATYRSMLEEVQLVLVDRVLSPHALQRLVLHRLDDFLDNLRHLRVADRVVVARLLLLH